MAIILSDNIKQNAPKPLEDWRGPYTGTTAAAALAAAVAAVPSSVRYKGRQVDLIIAGATAVYFWKSGIADADLVPLTTPLPQSLGAGDNPTFNNIHITGGGIFDAGALFSQAPGYTPFSAGINGATASDLTLLNQYFINNTIGGSSYWDFAANAPAGSSSNTYILSFPTSSGTIALLSDIATATSGKVDKITTINGKALSANVTLTADDIAEKTPTPTNLYFTVARGIGNGINRYRFRYCFCCFGN